MTLVLVCSLPQAEPSPLHSSSPPRREFETYLICSSIELTFFDSELYVSLRICFWRFPTQGFLILANKQTSQQEFACPSWPLSALLRSSAHEFSPHSTSSGQHELWGWSQVFMCSMCPSIFNDDDYCCLVVLVPRSNSKFDLLGFGGFNLVCAGWCSVFFSLQSPGSVIVWRGVTVKSAQLKETGGHYHWQQSGEKLSLAPVIEAYLVIVCFPLFVIDQL